MNAAWARKPPIRLIQFQALRVRRGGYSSEVEPQPSKLMTRVRFPLPAPVCVCRSRVGECAHIAQSVEHFLGKEEVIGSIPIVSTRISSTVSLVSR